MNRFLTYSFSFALCLFFLFVSALTSSAQDLSGEHITFFDVEVELLKSGDVKVRENITIKDAPGQSRRGIFRELPARKYNAEFDVTENVNYDMLSITRDGAPEEVLEQKIGEAWQWRIGNANRYLPNGEHTYQLVYTVENEIRYREDFDELLWNVTGNYWNYPVAKARVRVRVPEDAQVIDYNANTGRLGAAGQNFIAQRIGNEIIFETQSPLAAREGLTVSVSVPKGQIDGLTAADKQRYWWLKNGALLLITLVSLGIFSFYYLKWSKVGRDPAKMPVFARYEPPNYNGRTYSAAASQRILKRGLSGDKAIIATLIAMSGKGWIDMEVGKKTTTLTPSSQSERKFKLLPDEARLYKSLFGSRASAIKLAGKPNSRFNTARTSFERHIQTRYSKDYHRVNAGWIIMGIVLSLVGVAIAASQLNSNSSPYFMFLIGAIILTNIIFLFLMPAPTKLGQSVRAEIEGFKLYMETAEKERFNAVEVGSGKEPPMTVERYEAFLPYAIALGVEKPWTKYFEKTLPSLAETYQPSYAHGRGIRPGFGGGAIGGMNKSIVKSLSTGVQSARPVSTSSSGSSGFSGGGGGFSGGGGGGGGGGSW